MKKDDTFAHYKIIGPIGQGAMGEVFSARDTRLDREVAVKVLPADFATDPERLARFRREAKVLASLNHTNIAAIHGLEEDQGKIFLAMELAPGETLEARIDRGAMPADEALAVAVQIAAGLEEAHNKGIVHRDLKPANVKLCPESGIKILDFGLARAYQDEGEAKADPGTSPTLTAAMTQAGVILGTAAYMSPEQARGLEVDARTDIWAFGVILWELLAGRRLFAGATVTDTLAMVLRSDPDWSSLPTDLPPSLRRLLMRCLQRDKRQRMHHIADARIVLEEILQDGTSAYEPAAGDIAPMSAGETRKARSGWIAAAVLAVVAAVFGWQLFQTPTATLAPPIRFDITLAEDQWIAADTRLILAVSPAGDAVVISLETPQGTQLYLRSMADPALVPIPGTEDASAPFFSPDGKWLGFTKSGRLQKVALAGGSPIELCDTGWGGGTWTADDRIIFTRSYATGLSSVPASGGQPEILSRPDSTHAELGHWWPQVMPDQEWVIYTGYSTPIQNARIMALSLTTGEQKVLIEGGTFGRWAPTGHLLFVRDGNLLAAPFDASKMAVTGQAEAVLEDVYLSNAEGFSPLGFGTNGTLVYAPNSVVSAPMRLAWIDRQGLLTSLNLPDRPYVRARMSPDQRHIAVSVTNNHNSDIWLQDLRRGTFSRFTFTASSDLNPIWTPDSRTVIYNGEEPQYTIYQRPVDGSREPTLLLKKPVDTLPTSVSPDGKWVVYTESTVETGTDIRLLPLIEGVERRLFLQTDFNEASGVVSPDGQWLAYHSDESGRNEVYAMPFPDGGARWQVSIGGGQYPFWSGDGKNLVYSQQSVVMAVAVDRVRTTPTELIVSRPQPYMDETDSLALVGEREISPIGNTPNLLVSYTPEELRPRTLRVVVNWFSELR